MPSPIQQEHNFILFIDKAINNRQIPIYSILYPSYFLKRHFQQQKTTHPDNSFYQHTSAEELATLTIAYLRYSGSKSYSSFNPANSKHINEFLDWLEKEKRTDALLALWKTGMPLDLVLPRIARNSPLQQVKSFEEYEQIMDFLEEAKQAEKRATFPMEHPALQAIGTYGLLMEKVNQLEEGTRKIVIEMLFQQACDRQNTKFVMEILKDNKIPSSSYASHGMKLALRSNNLELIDKFFKESKTEEKQDMFLSAVAADNEDIQNYIMNTFQDEAFSIEKVLPAAIQGRSLLPALKLINRLPNVNQDLMVDAYNVFVKYLSDPKFKHSEESSELFRSFFKKTQLSNQFSGIPFSVLFDVNDPQLAQKVLAFYKTPDKFKLRRVLADGHFSPVTKNALEILANVREIHEIEMDVRLAISSDPESAMDDSIVLAAKKFFDVELKDKFEARFKSMGKDKKAAIVAIERDIRGMILDTIIAESTNDEEKAFVAANKEALMKANDAALMKKAREMYFKTPSLLHAAWRGYDPEAIIAGKFPNLLTEQQKVSSIFATRAAHEGAITNVAASDEVREMVAYYYLLVTDEQDGEDPKTVQDRIAARKANFISELADLRRAHSEGREFDSPSCYPGYLGRTLNMGYEHPLSKANVSSKNIILDVMRPFIIDKFKEALSQLKTQKECTLLLNALSNLTERDCLDIILGVPNIVYKEEWLTIRNNFIERLGDFNSMLALVNQALVERGYKELAESDHVYLKQYCTDPARNKLFGLLGVAYAGYVKSHFYAKEERKAPLVHTQALERATVNPFKAKYDAQYQTLVRMKIPDEMIKKRLIPIEKMANTYDVLSSALFNQVQFATTSAFEDKKGLGWLIELAADEFIENGIEINSSNALDQFNKIASELEKRLQEKPEEPRLGAALKVLSELSQNKENVLGTRFTSKK